MRSGDVAVVPDHDRQLAHIGVVGPYVHWPEFADEGYSHQRSVEWLTASSPVSFTEMPVAVSKANRSRTVNRVHADVAAELLRQFDQREGSDDASQSAQDAFGAVEGGRRTSLRSNIVRETRLRRRKIAEVLRRGGRIKCEVENCGFDFEAVYGALGRGFIHVHHLEDLKGRGGPTLTTLEGLMLVCPNCHAMVHLGGECRDPTTLIPLRR